jgi:DNA-directed RNA polymerase
MDKEFILKADSPFLFSAFCLNIKNLEKDPNYLVKMPVYLDATCSGIQHFAGLLLDYELASQVNLIKVEDDDRVKDLYQSLVKPINKAINIYGMDNSFEYSELMDVKLTRKELKSLIMTKSYNVTTYGMKGQLMNKFEKSENKRKITGINKDNKSYEYELALFKVPAKYGYTFLSEKQIMKMASVINDNIFTTYPSLNSIYKYLTEVTKIMGILDLPVS